MPTRVPIYVYDIISILCDFVMYTDIFVYVYIIAISMSDPLFTITLYYLYFGYSNSQVLINSRANHYSYQICMVHDTI